MGELLGGFSTPWRGFCSGLKATREGPAGLTRMLLSVFLNSARWKRGRTLTPSPSRPPAQTVFRLSAVPSPGRTQGRAGFLSKGSSPARLLPTHELALPRTMPKGHRTDAGSVRWGGGVCVRDTHREGHWGLRSGRGTLPLRSWAPSASNLRPQPRGARAARPLLTHTHSGVRSYTHFILSKTLVSFGKTTRVNCANVKSHPSSGPGGSVLRRRRPQREGGLSQHPPRGDLVPESRPPPSRVPGPPRRLSRG